MKCTCFDTANRPPGSVHNCLVHGIIGPFAPIPRGAFDNQEGGSHYKDMRLQPIEFIIANDLDWFQGNIVKYVCRHKLKGKEEDLKKVIHYAQLALEHHYKVKSKIEYGSKDAS